ncbi:MAG: hypothetical protein ACHQF3_14235 [Alphaproteobacteria bacterium]
MFVPEEVRKSVVLIGAMERGVFKPQATGFLVLAFQRRIPDLAFPYLVTAEHVVADMHRNRTDVYCRLNLRDGTAIVEPLGNKKWLVHPDESQRTDVAILPFWINSAIIDHDYIPLFNRVDKNIQAMRPGLLALGSEVFAIALFNTVYGKGRDIPIIRIGNIAAVPEGLVGTRHLGDIEAYLIELRSLAGLSGSPVFVNPTNVRRMEDASWSEHFFIGMVHGHSEAPALEEGDRAEHGLLNGGAVNAGIGIVVPAAKIVETLYQPDSVAQMRARAAARRQRDGVTRDLGVVPLPRRRHSFG